MTCRAALFAPHLLAALRPNERASLITFSHLIDVRVPMTSDLAAVREKLGGPGAAARAADEVSPFLSRKNLDTSLVP